MKKLFTLIELIVTIVVIGILAAIVIPNISSFKEEAKETAMISDGKNLQTAVDMYQLENHGAFPVGEVQPKLGEPKSLNFNLIHPENIRDLPQTKGMYYWVDYQGKFYYSSIDNPTDFIQEDSGLTWTANEKANGYTIHELESSNTSASNKPTLNLISELEGDVDSFTPEGYSKENTYLINVIDEYGNESAPVKSGYKGIPPFELVGGKQAIIPTSPEQEKLLEDPENKMIAIGNNHTLVVDGNGELWSFGYNQHGQLGHSQNYGTDIPNSIPKQIMSGVKSVSAGPLHTLVVKENGELWSFGLNNFGQLGYTMDNPTIIQNFDPKKVMNDVKFASAGGLYSLVIKENGELWSFGRNNHGQLGYSENDNPNPDAKQIMSDVNSVSAGQLHTIVLKENGKVFSFGNNLYGQLGHSTNSGTNNSNPLATEIMSGVKSIETGSEHTLVVTENGKLLSFGWNVYGQLGHSTNIGTSNPNPVATEVMSEVKSVGAGGANTLVIKENSSLWSFGYNYYGQLGHSENNKINKPNPVAKEVMSGVKSVETGGLNTLVVKENSEILSFGRNTFGQLGYSTNIRTETPNPIPKIVPLNN